LTGPRVGQYRALAKEHRLWISCGGFHELATDARTGAPEDKVFNTHLLLAPDGEIVTVYRKIHLFDVDIPNGPVLMESRSTKAGSDLAVCDTRKAHKHTAPATAPLTSATSSVEASSSTQAPAAAANVATNEKEPPPWPEIEEELGVVLGLTTCYDMRFPELYTLLRGKGCEAVLVPSAFTVPTGRAHWEVLLRARAIETQSFVLAAAQVGRHNEKRQSWGHAIIVDPWGVVLADAGGCFDSEETSTAASYSPTIVTARLDLNRLREVRSKMPITTHRRADLFTVAEVTR